jgi:hypothetical protein
LFKRLLAQLRKKPRKPCTSKPTRLDDSDFHWLRIGTDFNGPTPQNGRGRGVQLKGILSYNITRAWSVGIGGRYWRIETKDLGGTAHFERSASGLPQPITFKTERYGGFIQASYIFGAPIIQASYIFGAPILAANY